MGFFASGVIDRPRSPVLLFDAAALCLFAATGTQKALTYGLTPVMAAMLDVVTCVGGGVARDLLTRQVPTVLRSELHAVAALVGSETVALGAWLGLPHVPVTLTGSGLCLFLWPMSIYRGWRLPIAAAHNRFLQRTD